MRVGKIAGFDLHIHWSTLVIFILLVWGLAAVQLPDQAPDAADASYVIAAVVAGIAFYLGLLAHEVSHAVMARREGIEVDSLTLWVLGGVAALRGEPRTPGADLRIAGIGPIVSLAVAVVAAAVAAALDAFDTAPLVVATVGWLAGINAALGLFNLVPAAPLDGGRILRAALWAWRGDRSWAATRAAWAGEAFGFLLIGLGLAGLLYPGAGGVWFLVLGWFLLNAARREEAQAVMTSLLADVRLSSVMTRDPVTAPAGATVAELLDNYVLRSRHSAFPLQDAAGRPVGLVTLSHLRTVPPERRGMVAAGDVACPMSEVVTAAPDDRLTDLLPRLNACGEGRALVVEDDRIVGLITPTDVARALELAGLRRDAAGRPRRPTRSAEITK